MFEIRLAFLFSEQQVDVNGNKVGNNRPDLQYNFKKSDGSMVHIIVEYDHIKHRSITHGNVIRATDRSAIVVLRMLKNK